MTVIRRGCVALLVVLAWQSALSQDAAGGSVRLLVLDDYGSESYPYDLRVSPDGAQIAFTLDDRIHVVSRGNDARPLTSTASSAWSPRWARDGQSIYFLSDRSGSNQLWQLPVDDYGEATQLSEFEHGVSSLTLSPDESRILLSFSDDALAEESEEPQPRPFVVTRRQFKKDEGQGYITAGQAMHLYVYDIAGGELTQLTSGEYSETDAAWAPDGERVVFLSNREDPDADYRNDLWLLGTGGGSPDLHRLTDDTQSKQSPRFSPDGELVAYITAEDGVYGLQHIAVVPVAGGKPRVLTGTLDRWISSFSFSENGRWIYFNYDDAGSVHFARVRVSDGRIETLVDGNVQVSAFDVGAGIALALNNENDSTDIYSLRGRRLSRLTNLSEDFFAKLHLGDKIKVTADSGDGTAVDAFITTPPDFEPGESYPAVLNIHGGPVGQFAWGYSFFAQHLAANGYVVVEPNPRGSTGHGQDYIRAIYETWGITDYDDVIAAIDYAVERGFADPERLAVTGYSYGGYMTNVVITETHRFKAAASGAGHSLIEANFGHDIYQQWYMWELGAPWENRAKYDRLSPFLRVANVETPTLFYGGRVDWNVPILNAELMYQALKVRGIDSELIVYPGAHHGDWPESFEKDYQRRMVEWFDRYLKP